VFFTKTNSAKIDSANASARARAAGLAAQAAAQNAAQSAASAARSAAAVAQATAQTAASGVSSGVQQGVYSARSWTAPRLELAAEHVTKTVAPSVSSALRSTAKQVKPAEPTKRRTALTWSLLGAAILATAGAAFALIRYQFRAATQDEAVEVGETADASGRSTAATPAAPVTPAASSGASGTSSPSGASGASTATKTAASKTSADKTAADKTETPTDTSVNGHVASSGW
jgi:trimeric autotransporter adhesin